MKKKSKALLLLIPFIICLTFVGYSILHFLYGPEHTIITLGDLEFPIAGQKYTLTGESEAFKVTFKRYDGCIFYLRTGSNRLLQEVRVRIEYKGDIDSLGDGKTVEYKFDGDLDDRSFPDDVMSAKAPYIECSSSSFDQTDKKQRSELSLYRQELSITIKMNGKTEIIKLTE